MQRATIMAKPNKVVNNSVPFPIAYSFPLSNLTSLSFNLVRFLGLYCCAFGSRAVSAKLEPKCHEHYPEDYCVGCDQPK